jgi:hypothetical protein
MYKPSNPASNFISPANLFSVVRRLQTQGRRNALMSGSLGSGKVEAPATGDPDKFQSLLNVFRNRVPRLMND